MRPDSLARADRYLARRRRIDEAKALRRVGATVEDLRLWRRDGSFREAERVARVACDGSAGPRIIDLNQYVATPEDQIAAGWAQMDRLGLVQDPSGHRFQ